MEECIDIVSEGLRLEGLLAYSDELKKVRARVLICPPHPFLGGDMRNNVIRKLIPALTELDFLALTLNYRGIGKSETDENLEKFQSEFWADSTSPEYEKKIFVDCEKAFEVLRSIRDDGSPVMMIGYSFGCLPALELMRENKNIVKGVFISPPLAKWKWSEEAWHIPADKLLIYSSDDFACPEETVLELFGKMALPKLIEKIEGAGHFFVGQEKGLTDAVKDFLCRACV